MSSPNEAADAARRQTVEVLRDALARWDGGDADGFDACLNTLFATYEDGLRGRVVRLTRQVHEQVAAMQQDEHLARLAGDAMPDARERLDHVMRVTEAAAHRTLDLVDDARAVASGLAHAAQQVADTDAVLAQAHPDTASIGALLTDVRAKLLADAQRLRTICSDLAQAQEYQDIAGQLIKRVIALVHHVERALAELVRGDARLQSDATLPITEVVPALPGPAIAGRGAAAASQQDADALLLDLGF